MPRPFWWLAPSAYRFQSSWSVYLPSDPDHIRIRLRLRGTCLGGPPDGAGAAAAGLVASAGLVGAGAAAGFGASVGLAASAAGLGASVGFACASAAGFGASAGLAAAGVLV